MEKIKLVDFIKLHKKAIFKFAIYWWLLMVFVYPFIIPPFFKNSQISYVEFVSSNRFWWDNLIRGCFFTLFTFPISVYVVKQNEAAKENRELIMRRKRESIK